MSEIHIQEHASPIKNWKQVAVLAALAFVVPVLLIVSLVQIVTGGMRVDAGAPDMSEEAIAARIKPVGELNLGPGGAAEAPATAAPAAPLPAPAAAVQPAAAATAPAAAVRSGEEVHQQACAMCHVPGLAGAPRTGDKTAWQARIAQGKATLYEHAIKGFRTMPAKGGNLSLSDAEVRAAVDYLAAQAR
ncbi:MAG TPA: c-type cytochrome [Burkholderiales bacterium]|nr:c-type cytochrome [Burkholderiales bacterium]